MLYLLKVKFHELRSRRKLFLPMFAEMRLLIWIGVVVVSFCFFDEPSNQTKWLRMHKLKVPRMIAVTCHDDRAESVKDSIHSFGLNAPVEFRFQVSFQIEMRPELTASCMLTELMISCNAIQELSIGFHRSAACRFEMNTISLWKPVRWFRCFNHGMYHTSVLSIHLVVRKNSLGAGGSFWICLLLQRLWLGLCCFIR